MEEEKREKAEQTKEKKRRKKETEGTGPEKRGRDSDQ